MKLTCADNNKQSGLLGKSLNPLMTFLTTLLSDTSRDRSFIQKALHQVRCSEGPHFIVRSFCSIINHPTMIGHGIGIQFSGGHYLV
jgi:hypothetical protein